MAYKFSVGAYAHSGSLSSTSDITGSTTVSGNVGQFGTLTVATFSPANISSTNITASSNISSSTANIGTLTVGTFSPTNLTVTNDLTVNGNTTLGNNLGFDLTTFNSRISSSIEPSGSTFNLGDGFLNNTWNLFAGTISGSSTLQVGGVTTVKALSSSVGVSSSVGQFGTLTVATFSPATITTTSLTATTGSFTTVSGGFVDLLADSAVPNWDNTNGKFSNSAIVSSFGGLTTLSNGLTVTAGTSALQAVTATSLSSSGALTVAGATTLNGDLTVNGAITYVSSSVVEFKDVNLILASGSTTSAQVNGAGLTLGNTGYQLKFVSGSSGTPGDSWQFSGSAGFTDFTAGNITGASLINTKIVESLEATGSATINISKYITLADSTVADVTANLPAAGPSFTGVSYKVKNVGTRSVFVKSLGGTIDGVAGATGVTLGTQYAAATFACDGANWFVF